MGYNADLEYDLTFPSREAMLVCFADAVRDNPSGGEGFDAVISAISENADWDHSADDNELRFVGWGGGKLSWEHEAMLKVLADAAVTGHMDGRGEDGALWRWRFAEGEYKDYSGVITYPGDPYVEALTLPEGEDWEYRTQSGDEEVEND